MNQILVGRRGHLNLRIHVARSNYTTQFTTISSYWNARMAVKFDATHFYGKRQFAFLFETLKTQ